MNCCDESKETRFCKDCKHWRPMKGHCGVGRCNKLSRKNNLLRLAVGAETIMETNDLFGCIYFKPKPKGPFKVCFASEGHYILHRETESIIGYWHHKWNAEIACKFLNEQWTIAKGERRE